MYPIPTPTPFAYVATPYITSLDSSQYRVWAFADEAINLWNYNPAMGQVIQAMVLIILIIAFVVILIKLFQSMMSEE